jgi:Bacillus phage endonuclease
MPLKDPEARKQYMKEYRLKNLAQFTERDREYRESHKEQIYEKNKRYVEANRDKQREWVAKACRNWREKYGPDYYKKYAQREGEAEKHAARARVHDALKRGKLVRPDHCILCGKKCKPHAHHDDYAKPLEVIWLCSPCHKQADYKRSRLS